MRYLIANICFIAFGIYVLGGAIYNYSYVLTHGKLQVSRFVFWVVGGFVLLGVGILLKFSF